MPFFQAEYRLLVQDAAFVALAFAAWRWGAGPERWLAAVLVWFRVADWVNHAIAGPADGLATVDIGHVVIDAVGLVVAVAVALRANRIYPLWFAAFQLIAMMSHLARAIMPDIASIAYYAIFVIPSYCQIIVLAVGIYAHCRRVRRHGPYPAWRGPSDRLPAG